MAIKEVEITTPKGGKLFHYEMEVVKDMDVEGGGKARVIVERRRFSEESLTRRRDALTAELNAINDSLSSIAAIKAAKLG